MPQFHKVDLSSSAKIIRACLIYPLVLVLTTLLSCQLRENCLHDHRVNSIWEMHLCENICRTGWWQGKCQCVAE